MATRKVKTPRQRQQERKEQLQREHTVEKIISAMTETVTRLQTVSAWAQWQNNAEAMTKGKRLARGNTKFLRTRYKEHDDGDQHNDAAATTTDAETDGNADDDAADHATADKAVHGRADEDATRHDENSSQR